MTSLVDVLNRLGVKWQPTMIVMKDDKKKPRAVEGVLAKSTDFKDGEEIGASELLQRQKLLPHATHLAIDTRVIAQLDVDCETAMEHELVLRLLTTTPYFMSCRKKLPHFLITIVGERLKSSTCGVRVAGKKPDGQWRVELLWGKWSWADKETPVHNAHLSPAEVTREEFDRWVGREHRAGERPAKRARSASCPSAPVTADAAEAEAPSRAAPTERSRGGGAAVVVAPAFTEDMKKNVERYVRGFSKERATAYGTWSQVVFGIMNIAHTHRVFMAADVPNPMLLEWAREQAHIFSAKSDAYDHDGVDRFMDAFKPRAEGEARLGVSALSKFYHEDRDSREESEDESESPLRSATEDQPKASVFDAAMKFVRRRRDELALCGEEVLWIEHGRWATLTVTGLARYMNFTEARRAAYGIHALNAKGVHQQLAIAASSKEGRTLVKRTSAFFKEDVGDASVGKLAWEDGVYDFALRKLLPVTPDNAGLTAVRRRFPLARDAEEEARVMDYLKLIFPYEPERAAFLYAAARALAGHVADQRMLTLVGATSNGKTSLRNFFVRSFPGVVGVFNAAHLSSTRTDDADRANTWLIPCEGMRLCFSDELTTNRLNGGRIKAVSMGDVESIGVRRLYSEGSSAVITAAFCLLLNAPPNIEPADAAIAKRMYAWEMRSTFVDEDDQRIITKEAHFHPVDRDLSKHLRRDEGLHNALFWLLVDAYAAAAPSLDSMRCTPEEKVEDEMPDLTAAFKCSEDKKDFIFNKNIASIVKARFPKLKLGQHRIFAALKDMGAVSVNSTRLNKDTGKQERFHTNVREVPLVSQDGLS